MNNVVIKSCPMCSSITSLKLSKSDYEKYIHKYPSMHIQDIFPNMDLFKREFLLSGYCPMCQELLFGRDYKLTKNWNIV